MKRYLVILSVVLSLLLLTAVAASAQSATKAEELFQAQRYSESLRQYEALLKLL